MRTTTRRKSKRIIWKVIPTFENLYEVSEYGEVRSLITNSQRRAKILKPKQLLYPQVTLYHLPNTCQYTQVKKTGLYCKGHPYRAHTLVMLSFVGPRPEDAEVRHLDDNKYNNHISNLQYGTSKQNAIDTVLNGNNFNSNKTHCPKGHPYNYENTKWVKVKGRRPSRQCITCDRKRKR